MKNTALITGASSGIGKELATIHAEKGGNLIRKVLGSGAERREVGKKMVLDAQELGIKVPTAGVASGSPLLQFIEKRIEQFPTAKNQFAENFDVFKRSLVKATEDISKKYSQDSGMSGEQIGGKIRGGIDKAKLKFSIQLLYCR